MKDISPFRMALWTALVTLSCALLVTGSDGSGMILGLSGLALATRGEMKKTIPTKTAIALFAVITLLFILQFVLLKIWSEEQLEFVATHPAFVFPMWGLILAFSFKKWWQDRHGLAQVQAG